MLPSSSVARVLRLVFVRLGEFVRSVRTLLRRTLLHSMLPLASNLRITFAASVFDEPT